MTTPDTRASEHEFLVTLLQKMSVKAIPILRVFISAAPWLTYSMPNTVSRELLADARELLKALEPLSDVSADRMARAAEHIARTANPEESC